MVKEIMENIEMIQESTFNYDIVDIQNRIGLIIEQISSIIPIVETSKIGLLNEILMLISSAMENRDYLLVADVLYFELKPFLLNNLRSDENILN